MSTVAIPAMKKYGYHPILNAGSVAAGATLGVLIPPSIVLVVYGIYTGQSIGKLFFGNIIPSAIATVLIAATVFVICRRHPDWGPAAPASTWTVFREALYYIPSYVITLIILALFPYRTGLILSNLVR
jgi:TRAP-type C4-dicarboxylate transport system permease large subunit